jgi:PAS domain S-box-containing protein
MKKKKKTGHDDSADLRKRAEEALRESEERYRRLVETAPEVIYNLSADDGTITLLNPAFERITGWSRAEWLGKPFMPLVHPDDLTLAMETFQHVSRGEPSPPYELRILSKSGEYLIGEFTSFPYIEKRKVIGEFGIARDITERKRAEEAVRKSEEKYRGLTENINLGIYRNTVGPEGQFIEANPALIGMFGYKSKEEFLAINVSDLYQNPEDRTKFNDKMLKEGVVRGEELWLKKKDGSLFVGSVSAVAVKDEQGHVKYYDGIIDNITERKRADEALRESEEKYRNLVERANDGIVIVQDGIVKYINARLAEMRGVTVEEVIGTPFTDHIYPDELPEVVDRYKQRMAGEDVSTIYETTLRRRDGSKIHAELNAGMVTYQGKPADLVIIRDITERKRAEEALRESEEKFRGIFENVLDVYYETAIDGTILEVSPSIEILSEGQYHRDDLIGKSMNDFYSDPGKRQTLLEALQERGNVTDYEIKLKNRDGLVIPCSISSKIRFDAQGRPEKILGTIRDITERKRAEEALKKSEEYFRALTENSSDIIIILDKKGTITYTSPSIERFSGYKPEELIGKSGFDFIKPIDLPKAIYDFGKSILTKDTVIPNAFRVRHKDGSERILDGLGKNLLDNPVVAGFVMNTRDVTERKRAEEEVRRKAKELQEKNEELTRFTYAVAHDLRGPLVTIQTFQGHLERDIRSRDAARVGKDLGYIRNAADKMGRLLDDIRRLSRVGRITNPSEEAPLQAIVKEALDLVAGRITGRGVKVQVTEEPVVLTGDRTRLVEVFLNLVDNAAKFMGDEPAPRVEIGVEQAGEELVLHVRDNGIGIDPQLQPMLFSLFHKLDPETEGEGIGLALVRRIVELHGGRIWVESEGPGKGATFRFTLAKTRRDRAEEGPLKLSGSAG